MTDESPALRAARKDDHLRLALRQRADVLPSNEFDDLTFVHHALAAADVADVELATRVGDWTWPVPFYVNAMTGGTELTDRINLEIATAARETGLPMACGSVSVGLDDSAAARGFAAIRRENPDGFVMANLGIGRSADDAARAVELLRADALQVHINAVQETAMPEGTRDFSGWLASLEGILAASQVPVIVKEVGFGLSDRTLVRLADLGVRVADVSGRGGTDFLRIENDRTAAGDFSMLTGFGQSALACLLDAPPDGPQLLASGGVRNPYDVVKGLAAGARAMGVAAVFLEVVAAGGAEALVPLIRTWKRQLAALLRLLGAADVGGLGRTDLLVRGRLREFCELRGVDVQALARRSQQTPAAPDPAPRRMS